MKIATWNIERLKHKNAIAEIVSQCDSVMADILVLTETDERVSPNYKNCLRTVKLSKVDANFYGAYENRVSIYTDYEVVNQYDTYDMNTAICAELETDRGRLLVYGTIIGVFGNRHHSFKEDLRMQIEDIKRLAGFGKPMCICGDYNLSFADNYYFTNEGRNLLLNCFDTHQISLLTKEVEECIDHIAVSEEFCGGRTARIEEWNQNKKLSDHKGIMIEIGGNR